MKNIEIAIKNQKKSRCSKESDILFFKIPDKSVTFYALQPIKMKNNGGQIIHSIILVEVYIYKQR